ncbi:MAG: DNA polymerase ligase N-terminal domain-containing protein [Spirochaeta sp.]
MGSLRKYKEKRDLSKTPEPSGTSGSDGTGSRFVIQKHSAGNLHYDFRLEIDGVLVSWAVPKGLSLNPADTRLAIRTEDHPLEYIDFEGVIPKDQYGGGTVIVWDTGTYTNLRRNKDDTEVHMHESLEDGKIEVRLYGEKLSGGYALIQTRGKGADSWIIKKMKDDEADARRNPVSTQPNSVLSNLSIEGLEAEEKDPST